MTHSQRLTVRGLAGLFNATDDRLEGVLFPTGQPVAKVRSQEVSAATLVSGPGSAGHAA